MAREPGATEYTTASPVRRPCAAPSSMLSAVSFTAEGAKAGRSPPPGASSAATASATRPSTWPTTLPPPASLSALVLAPPDSPLAE